MLHLSGISKSFGGRVVLEQATLQLPHRAVIGLVGPNGSGKTTLLSILSGDTEPDTGSIVAPGGARIGKVGQDVTLQDHGSVLQTILEGLPTVDLLEKKLVALGTQLEQEDPAGQRHQDLLDEIAALQTEHDLFDSSRLEPRARKLLTGLGIDRRQQDNAFSTLSGGWQMRTVLARVLLTQPQVLLLDEPTNHLDIDALIWLEQFLVTYDGLVIITSHDRTFLDRAITHVLAIEDKGLWFEPGHYSAYLHHRQQRMEQLQALRDRQLAEKQKLEKFVARFQAKATKARQAQSRKKQLEKMEDIEVIELPPAPPAIYFSDPPPAPKIMLEVQNLSKRYDSPELFSSLDWVVQRGTKAALVGPNGSGKSTMLRILAGVSKPDSGVAQFGPRVKVGYFAQDQGEQLPAEMTPLTWLLKQHGTMSPGTARNLLGRYRFGGSLAEQKIVTLSGGEKARLYLAHLAASDINFLLLDEPTNHLDIESRAALATALKKWPGDMIVVSHDRAFLNRFVDTVVDLHCGEVIIYPGTMTVYEDRLRQRRQDMLSAKPDTDAEPDARRKTGTHGKGGNLWKERKKLQGDFRKTTREVEQADEQVGLLKAKLEDPGLASDHTQLIALQKELDQARKQAEKSLALWEKCIERGKRIGVELLGD